ncbi:RCC1 domain-containing protein 1 [Zeugodacus cucurbitae]|uniref:RCC1 domain-containing protein 1 n=1 Tax=Zeugodacus cucurbitae TaxID=28588 RepID=UPI0023D95285|nr:RCC1 domain-containing protein 1 [Zeugodacus cucurbitae]
MLAFSGFNGFGQFGVDSQRSGNAFTDITLEKSLTGEQSVLHVAISWSYTAFAIGNQLILCGFLSSTPYSTLCLQISECIVQLAACDRFCLVLCKNGKLYKVRAENEAQLQEVKLEAEVQALPQKRTIFGEMKKASTQAEHAHITHIACGANINVAISEANAVYSVPSKIHQFSKHFRVKQLQCGFEHAVLLSANGDVYSWGNGFRGQLGHDVLRVEETPLLIEALAGIKINFIAAAGWHSAAISAFGDLYTWGFNSNGQLGIRMFKATSSGNLKQPTVFTLPQIIDLPACKCLRKSAGVESVDHLEYTAVECTPLRIYAGARHTLLQMNCGALYAAGWNAHGQLGLGRKVEYCDEFEHVECAESDLKDMQIVCGSWSTVIFKYS